MNIYLIAASLLMLFELVVPRAKLMAPQNVLSVALAGTGETETRVVTRRPVAIEPLAPTRILLDSLGVALTARSAVVMDVRSKAMLWEQNPNDVRPVASITKLVTALVAIDALPQLDGAVTIQKEDYINEGFNSLPIGGVFTASDILTAMLVESNNTAAYSLVRATGKTRDEFVALMNEYVTKLGLTHTSFVDPTGLSADNVSTAAEVLQFAQKAFQEKTIGELTGLKTATVQTTDGRSFTVRSTNQLIGSMVAIVNGKTGFVNESGYNLVAQSTRDGHPLLAVVLGSATNDDRFQDYKALVHWTWEHFIWPEPLKQ